MSHDSELEIVDADDIEEPEAAHRPLCPSWWAIHPKIAAAYADAHRAHEREPASSARPTAVRRGARDA